MTMSPERYLYSNDYFVRFVNTRADYLGIKLYYPTSEYKLSTLLNTIAVKVYITIGETTIEVIKAVGYELPGCVESFKQLSYEMKEKVLTVISENLKIAFDNKEERYSLELEYFVVDPFSLDSSYGYCLNYLTGCTNLEGMTIDHLLENSDLELAVNLAMTSEGGIGYNDILPWWIPDELFNFRTLTTGKLVVVGYKTFSKMGPLRDRVLLVMSSTGSLPYIDWGSSKGIIIAVKSYKELVGILATTKMQGTNEVAMIGGPKTIDLFKGKYSTFNQTIVEQYKVEVEPNVFISPDPRFFLEAEYTETRSVRTGVGWVANRYRRN